MQEDGDKGLSVREKWSGRLGFLIAAIALIAWFAMLWLMFGDVL
jgi:hypothetical protein